MHVVAGTVMSPAFQPRAPLKRLLILLCLLAACACSPRSENQGQAPAQAPVAGADRDAHGCIPSAGYTWSPVRGACIRLFEDGVRFEEYEDPKGRPAVPVYVVVAPAQGSEVTAGEVHVPGRAEPISLTVVHTPEGDIMPLLMANKAERTELYLRRDSLYLSIQGLQYHCFCDKEERIRYIR